MSKSIRISGLGLPEAVDSGTNRDADFFILVFGARHRGNYFDVRNM